MVGTLLGPPDEITVEDRIGFESRGSLIGDDRFAVPAEAAQQVSPRRGELAVGYAAQVSDQRVKLGERSFRPGQVAPSDQGTEPGRRGRPDPDQALIQPDDVLPWRGVPGRDGRMQTGDASLKGEPSAAGQGPGRLGESLRDELAVPERAVDLVERKRIPV